MTNRLIRTAACLILLLPSLLHAQSNREQDIQDSVIGWWNNNRFDQRVKPSGDPVQKKKLDQIDKLISFVKQSYTPVGGLGTTTRTISSNTFGIQFLAWNVSYDKTWLDAQGHFKPVDEENTLFGIAANLIPGSYPVDYINPPPKTGGDYYFTWPPDGYYTASAPIPPGKGFPAKLNKYILRSNEWQTVFLAPNNQLPFIPVTRGEYLDRSEAAIPAALKKEMEKATDRYPDNLKARDEVYAANKKVIDSYAQTIRDMRVRYKNSLDQPAVLNHLQPGLPDFYPGDDVFEKTDVLKNPGSSFPVYRIDAAMREKCKGPQAQWLAIYLPLSTSEDGNKDYEMYTAMTQNLNYDYIYSFLFDPASIAGKPYTVADPEGLRARLTGYRNTGVVTAKRSSGSVSSSADEISGASKPAGKKPANAIFFDDFSSNANGSKPGGWYFSSFQKASSVTELNGEKGSWLKLGHNEVSPKTLQLPLPANFTVGFDIVTDGGYDSRTGGAVRLDLNSRGAGTGGNQETTGAGSTTSITFTAGNTANYESNYMGALDVDVRASPSLNVENHSGGIFLKQKLVEFNNGKQKIHVAVSINNDVISIKINGVPAATSKQFKLAYGGDCIECGVPKGTRIRSIFWRNLTNDEDAVGVYISNVVITKD